MLKKLKTKFIVATIAALTIILTVIVGTINAFNYQIVVSDADDTLALLMENSGKFPSKPDIMDPDLDIDIDITPETPYESRHFTVVFEDGKIVSVDTSSIAAIDDDTAIQLSQIVLSQEAERDFLGNYRFLVGQSEERTSVHFLDCTKSLGSVRTFILLSIIISLVGVLAVFLLLWIIAERIVTPIADGHEKQKTFITNAGHDIKTPITIIDADAELLEMEIGENEWLDDIKKQTDRLARLTSDLIYLSRLEEEQSTPHIDFPLSDLIEEVASSFSAPARTKQITLSCLVPRAMYYTGDEDSIRKLITILLDNAIKYSPDGEEVEVGAMRQGRFIVIRITNIAPGVTDASLKRMFDRFYRSDASRSTGGGFGIGLSVASAIVSAHKGKIIAEKQGDRLAIEVVL